MAFLKCFTLERNSSRITTFTALKVSKYGGFSGPNAGKYGPEKSPHLDTFHAVPVPRVIATRLSPWKITVKECHIP